jgi:hypothetical protein
VIFNKFEKNMHLVDFTIEIYYDARSHECKKYTEYIIAFSLQGWLSQNARIVG